MDKNSNTGERVFLTQMAEEVRRNPDPKLQELVLACEGKAAVLRQCLGKREDQKKHAAVMASTLYLDLNFMMNSHEVLPDRTDHSVWTEEDVLRVVYHYELDTSKGEIRVLPHAIRAVDGSHYENVEFLELQIHFPVPDTPTQSPPAPETSPIILP